MKEHTIIHLFPIQTQITHHSQSPQYSHPSLLQLPLHSIGESYFNFQTQIKDDFHVHFQLPVHQE